MGRLLLNSRGLNTKIGSQQIHDKLKDKDLQNKKMFIVSYTPYGVDETIVQNCVEILGFRKENLFLSVNGTPKNVIPDYIYVTEGNTFEVLQYMRSRNLVDYIRELMKDSKKSYIGSSAGAIIAGTDIMLARDFDSNFVGMIDFTALHLFDGTIIPHFEPEHLENYIKNTEKHILNRYSRILSVSNEEVITIENGEIFYRVGFGYNGGNRNNGKLTGDKSNI